MSLLKVEGKYLMLKNFKDRALMGIKTTFLLKVTGHLQIDNFLHIWIFESKYWLRCDL